MFLYIMLYIYQKKCQRHSKVIQILRQTYVILLLAFLIKYPQKRNLCSVSPTMKSMCRDLSPAVYFHNCCQSQNGLNLWKQKLKCLNFLNHIKGNTFYACLAGLWCLCLSSMLNYCLATMPNMKEPCKNAAHLPKKIYGLIIIKHN